MKQAWSIKTGAEEHFPSTHVVIRPEEGKGRSATGATEGHRKPAPPEPPRSPPPQPAGAPPPAPGEATGIANAQVDAARVRLGLSPAMQAAAETHGQWWNDAMAVIEADAKAPEELERSLADEPRALTPVETAMLTHRKITLETDYHEQLARGEEALANHDNDALQSARLRRAQALDQLNGLFDVTKSVGTKSGQSLAARKLLVNRDMTVAHAVTEARMLKGDDLTPKEEQEVTDRFNKAKDAQDRADAAAAEEQATARDNAGKEVLNQIQQQLRLEKVGAAEHLPFEQHPIVQALLEHGGLLSKEGAKSKLGREGFARNSGEWV